MISTIIDNIINIISEIIKNIFKQRNEEIEYIKRQLNELYIPLYSKLKKMNVIATDFFNKVNATGFFDTPHKGNEKSEWRILMENILSPLNKEISELIQNKSPLLLDGIRPECFDDFDIHVGEYEIIIQKWKNGDFEECFSRNRFPQEIYIYVETSINTLQKRLSELENGKKVKYEESDKYKINEININSKDITYAGKLYRIRENAIKLLLQKDYNSALILLHILKNEIIKIKDNNISEKYHIQLWKDFNAVISEYIKNNKELFYNCLKNKLLTGIVNYKIFYKEEDIDKLEFSDKLICKRYTNDENGNKIIICSFALYDEVKIIDCPIKDTSYDNIDNIDFFVRINNEKTNLYGKYLWFFPDYTGESA